MTTIPRPEPSALPWELVYEGDAEKCHPAIIQRRPTLEIRVSGAESFYDPLPDAKFILKAVNAYHKHLALIAELQEALEKISKAADNHECGPEPCHCHYILPDDAKDALARSRKVLGETR